jgi:hypothetical protein
MSKKKKETGEKGSRRLSQFRVLQCVIAGFLGSAMFIFLFPGASITTAMHDVLELPGPGAGIGFVYGPFITMVAVAMHMSIRRPLTILLTCTSFGVFHTILATVVYGDVKTAGTIGPPHLRILAVVVLGLVLEGVVFILKNKRPLIRYPLASIPANIAIMVFYWRVIFPNSPKGTVLMADVPVLLGVTVLGAVAIGGLLPVLIHHLFFWKRSEGEKE